MQNLRTGEGVEMNEACCGICAQRGGPVGMFGGCHSTTEGIVGPAIIACTTWFPRWLRPLAVSTHTSVGFIYADGYREIFEAREGKSWQGPIPVEKVEAWVARNQSRRRFTMYDIPRPLIDQSIAGRKHALAMRNRAIWKYSLRQLPRMGLRKWLPFLPLRPTPNAVVCSEAATIVLDPECGVLRTLGLLVPDRVTPYLFEKAMKAICKKPYKEPACVADEYSR